MIRTILGKKDYYEPKTKNYREGQLGWAPILYTTSISGFRKLIFDNSGAVTGIEEVTSVNSFRNTNPPLVEPFRLETNEEVLCIKAKKRPVILFSQADPGIKKAISNNKSLDIDLRLGKVWLTLPMRSYKDDHFKLLVESLYYPVFFPFIGNKTCPIEDGYIRFDNILPIHQTLIELEDYSLTDSMMIFLVEAFITYTTKAEFGDTYPYYRDIFLEQLKKDGII